MQHLLQWICSRSSVIVRSSCRREDNVFIFIGYLRSREGKLDYTDGELTHKDAVFHKHLGTCLTDKCRSILCVIRGFLGSQPDFP